MVNTTIAFSGKVFTDLGYFPEDATMLQMHVELMIKLRTFIEIRKLTRANAAKFLRINP